MLPPFPKTPALFLDVDGTLIGFSADPADVRTGPELRARLASLQRELAGAVALLSGRRLAQLDAMFAPLALPAAGLHGLERRDATGLTHVATGAAAAIAAVRPALSQWVAQHPGLVLEDKGGALAVHYRGSVALGAEIERAARRLIAQLGPTCHVQPGHLVYEIKSRLEDKGTALRAFMREQPFSGRVPVMIGDDLTDLDAFRAAEELGGFAIAVGDRVTAQWTLPDHGGVIAWLADLGRHSDRA